MRIFRRIFFLLVFHIATSIAAQIEPEGTKTVILVNGRSYDALITNEGDTLILTSLEDANIVVTRSFENDEEYRKFLRMKAYAAKVAPIAKEAIKIYRELEYAEKIISSRERKRKIKQLDAELSAKFTDSLTNLTKLQGKILVKMIERDTKVTMHEIIKGVKGGFKAFTWNAFSKLYDYNLKEGYKEGDYPILDAVLADYNLSYQIDNDTDLQYIKLDRSKMKKK